jgi:hypothetical protein
MFPLLALAAFSPFDLVSSLRLDLLLKLATATVLGGAGYDPIRLA